MEKTNLTKNERLDFAQQLIMEENEEHKKRLEDKTLLFITKGYHDIVEKLNLEDCPTLKYYLIYAFIKETIFDVDVQHMIFSFIDLESLKIMEDLASHKDLVEKGDKILYDEIYVHTSIKENLEFSLLVLSSSHLSSMMEEMKFHEYVISKKEYHDLNLIFKAMIAAIFYSNGLLKVRSVMEMLNLYPKQNKF
jgi:hypothetical protein